MGHSERAQQLLALETAIEQIEVDLAENNPYQKHSRANLVAAGSRPRVEIIPPDRQVPPLSHVRYEIVAPDTRRPGSSMVRWALVLVVTAILGGATYAAIQRGLHEQPQSKPVVADTISRNSDHSSSFRAIPTIPSPGAYGIYALTDGKLTELEPLPIRVPDQRIAISAIISSPSSIKLPNGRLQFIAFQRDLVNNAPEKVTVRVVARVIAASAFENKRSPTMDNLGSAWVVRGISYEMKVAPIDGNAAMILIRPIEGDFSFPPGRYALVLKNVAYDFSVDGPVSDVAQCVERSDEVGAPIFTECPKQ